MDGYLSPLDAERRLSRHTLAVRARIERLNPRGLREGWLPRGWHPSGDPWVINGLIPKMRFIRRYGREAWDALTARDKAKYGKREYALRAPRIDAPFRG